jgi:hypothetical protein
MPGLSYLLENTAPARKIEDLLFVKLIHLLRREPVFAIRDTDHLRVRTGIPQGFR